MEIAELVLKYIEALVWPAVTVGLVWGLRNHIRDAFGRMTRLETPAGDRVRDAGTGSTEPGGGSSHRRLTGALRPGGARAAFPALGALLAPHDPDEALLLSRLPAWVRPPAPGAG